MWKLIESRSKITAQYVAIAHRAQPRASWTPWTGSACQVCYQHLPARVSGNMHVACMHVYAYARACVSVSVCVHMHICASYADTMRRLVSKLNCLALVGDSICAAPDSFQFPSLDARSGQVQQRVLHCTVYVTNSPGIPGHENSRACKAVSLRHVRQIAAGSSR